MGGDANNTVNSMIHGKNFSGSYKFSKNGGSATILYCWCMCSLRGTHFTYVGNKNSTSSFILTHLWRCMYTSSFVLPHFSRCMYCTVRFGIVFQEKTCSEKKPVFWSSVLRKHAGTVTENGIWAVAPTFCTFLSTGDKWEGKEKRHSSRAGLTARSL